MSRIALLAVIGLSATALGAQPPTPPTTIGGTSTGAASAAPTEAAKFYLDYDVPESPAFALLGVSPSNVLRGTASKPAVVSLASDLATGSRIAGGVALDVAPYAYFGRFRNVDEYKNDKMKRFWANALLSLATVQVPKDTASTAFAVGGRLTFHDDHDLIANSDLQTLVGELLVPTSIKCTPIEGTNICQKGETEAAPVDVSSAYAAARDEVSKKPGWALSAGGAFGGTLHGGVPKSDSLRQRTGQLWLAGTKYIKSGSELLGMAGWVRDTAGTNRLRAGAAYRYLTATSSLSAELAYDSGAGGVLPGANAEVRLLDRVTLVAAIVTDVPTSENERKRIRFKTSLRWPPTEGF